MDSIPVISDRGSLTRISEKEEKLKRLDQANNVSFDDELAGAISKKGNVKKPLDKKLWDSCVEAESLFVGKMIKEMKKSVQKSEWLHGGQAEEIFEDMLYDEYALNMSKNSNFGMAKLLYDELSRRA